MWGEGGGRKDERKEGEREGKEGEREGKEGEREGKGEREREREGEGEREGGGKKSDVHVTSFFYTQYYDYSVSYSQHFDYLCQDLQYYQYKQNLKTKKQTKGSSLQRQRGTDHR